MLSFILILLSFVNAFAIRGKISESYPDTLKKSVVQVLKKKEIKIEDSVSAFTHSCTGTIINSNTVLTAAHCFDDKNFSLSISYQGLTYDVEEVLIHSSYKREDLFDEDWGFVYDIKIENDIALIKTKSNLPPDFAPLRRENDLLDIKTPSLISGYGQTANIFGLGSGEGTYRVSAPTLIDVITPNRIIINDGATGGCQGDSGGPLWALISETWIQVAITSQGDCNVQTQFETVSEERLLNSEYESIRVNSL